MKLDDRYDSRIGKLFPNQLDNYFFISDWDLHNPKFMFNTKAFYTKMFENDDSSINDYYFINERNKDKLWLEQVLNLNVKEWYKRFDFSIFPNGTSAASVILHTLNKGNKLRALLLSPTYFTYIDILKEMSCEIYYYPLISPKGDYYFNIKEIGEIITEFNINIIIITYPLFGSGISMPLEQLNSLLLLCEKSDIFLFIDYIYGGIDWDESPKIFPNHLMRIINNNTAVLISLSKNLFLNGAKTCLVFASDELIEEIEKQSVYTLGSMTQSQMISFKIIYDIQYRSTILNRLNNIREYAKNSYELLSALCALQNYKITESNSGIFTLVGIQKDIFTQRNDDRIAKIILETCGILTIPHSRYLLYSDDYYWFRINLSYPSEKLIPQFQKLIQINFY